MARRGVDQRLARLHTRGAASLPSDDRAAGGGQPDCAWPSPPVSRVTTESRGPSPAGPDPRVTQPARRAPRLRAPARARRGGGFGFERGDLTVALELIGDIALRIGDLLPRRVHLDPSAQHLETRVLLRPHELGFGLSERGAFGLELLLEARRVETEQQIAQADRLAFGGDPDDLRRRARQGRSIQPHLLCGRWCRFRRWRVDERLNLNRGGWPRRRRPKAIAAPNSMPGRRHRRDLLPRDGGATHRSMRFIAFITSGSSGSSVLRRAAASRRRARRSTCAATRLTAPEEIARHRSRRSCRHAAFTEAAPANLPPATTASLRSTVVAGARPGGAPAARRRRAVRRRRRRGRLHASTAAGRGGDLHRRDRARLTDDAEPPSAEQLIEDI